MDDHGTTHARRRSPLAARALAALLIAGAAPLPGCGNPAQGPIDSNLAYWTARRPARYRYAFRWSCFCAPEYTADVLITVENNVVKEVVDATTSAPVKVPSDWKTIDGLFSFLQEAIDRNADSITATYDPAWHFPADVSIDYIKNAADDEKGFRASNLTVLP